MQLKTNFSKIMIFGLTVVLLFTFCGKSQKVHADAAPPPGAIGSDLYPNLNATKVRMEAETVVITIPENCDYYGYSIVTATFYMRNMGEDTEEMKARFPMNLNEYGMLYELETGTDYCGYSDFPSIDNLSVRVNNQETNIVTTTKTIEAWWSSPENSSFSTFNCWAYFDVTFPPGEQVIIQIQYKVGGYKWESRQVSYKYIMQTGQGWYDTIGTADVVVKLPYEVNDTNIIWCRPEDYSYSGDSVSWHFENFEPQENIQIDLIDPSIWSNVVRESANVEKNPEDWEAWGRLGKAYKDIIIERKGHVLKIDYPDLYKKSVEAYQKAVEHLPDDADWHWGYADLLCSDSNIFDGYQNTTDEEIAIENECFSELKKVLLLNPNQQEASEYLLQLYKYAPEYYTKYNLEEIGEAFYLPAYTLSPTLPPARITTSIPIYTRTATGSSTPSPTKTPAPIITPAYTLTLTPTILDIWKPINILDMETKHKYRLIFDFIANIILVALFVVFIQLRDANKPH
jgi:tetratricopeptide (TPR) repeat protein